MKKLSSFVVFTTLLYSSSLFGQVSFTPNFGINTSLSNKINNNIPDFSNKNPYDLFIGGNINYKISKKLSANLDFQYSPKRVIAFSNITSRITYLDLHETIQYSAFKFMSIYGGLNIGVNVKEELYSKPKWFASKPGNIGKKYDFGALIGLKFPFKKFTLFSQYNQSIFPTSDLIVTDDNGSILPNNIRNRNLQIGIGYTFGEKK
jgi:hypothetical protein